MSSARNHMKRSHRSEYGKTATLVRSGLKMQSKQYRKRKQFNPLDRLTRLLRRVTKKKAPAEN